MVLPRLTPAERARRVLESLREVDREIRTAAAEGEVRLGGAPSSETSSAANLMAYVALRRRDLRDFQAELAALGLSALEDCEADVLGSIGAVLDAAATIAGEPAIGPRDRAPESGVPDPARSLEERAAALFGPRPPHRRARILVTLPVATADDSGLVRSLLEAGMDVARVNCAHDDPAIWEGMVERVRQASRESGRPCRIYADVAGPKVRTGDVVNSPRAVKWRPRRDGFGHVLGPARIWLHPAGTEPDPPGPADASIPVPPEWLSELREGEPIRFTDTRGARRKMRLEARAGHGAWATCRKTSYVAPGVTLRSARRGREAEVGEMALAREPLRLYVGDVLRVTRPGAPAPPPAIACTLPEVFLDVRPGEAILFDDGRIAGVVRSVAEDGLEVGIVRADPGGSRLGPGKSVNLPESGLRLPALTRSDLETLPFIARAADLVGLSFVRGPQDVQDLRLRLAALGDREIPIVLKIETRRAVENLPELLLAALRSPVAGVMIARGDLAVECGMERLPELQERILALAGAARLPSILATGVLERLASRGVATRAEMTDADLAARAECVLLNRGPCLPEAIRFLDGVLQGAGRRRLGSRSLLDLLPL